MRREAGVRVLALWLDRPAEEVAALGTLLSEAERLRAGRFHLARDRARFIVARAHLRRALGDRLGCDAAGVGFGEGPHGQPFVVGATGQGPLFSVSHSGGLALLAFSDGVRLGVDVERIRPGVDAAGLSERFFAPGERDWLASLDNGARTAGFFQCWTAKEALLKAVGLGLTGGLAAVVFRPSPQGLALDRSALDEVDPAEWTIVGLEAPEGFVAALAVHAVEVTVALEWIPGGAVRT